MGCRYPADDFVRVHEFHLSVLNGRWISYSEYYTDGYWKNHPRRNMNLYAKNFATNIEIEHRQHETIFRTGLTRFKITGENPSLSRVRRRPVS